MFDLAVPWLIVTVDISVKAMVLAAVAMLSLRLLKLHDSNLRHRTWTGVLIGMLLLPVLSQTLPALQLPVAVPEHWKIAQHWRIDERRDVSPAAARVDIEDGQPIAIGISQQPSSYLAGDEASVQSGFYQSESSDDAWSTLPEVGPEAEFGTSSLSLDVTDNLHPTVAELDSDDTEIASSTPLLTAEDRRPPLWPVSLLVLWLAGAGVMALRLLAGVAYSLRLVWSSTVITSKNLEELGIDFRWLTSGDRRVMTHECPLIRVPVALGVMRPRILLPSDWKAWPTEKLQAVIAHEQTHIQRADGAVILLAEVNRCLYWFHPVAWWLRSQLGQLAETACDDAAIDCTGDRATYARHLLEVASAVSDQRGRLISVGISMARRSNVETRINAILDLTRPLSKRLTTTTTLLLFGALVPLITLAAAVQPATETIPQSSSEQSATDDPSAKDDPAESNATDDPGTNRTVSNLVEDRQRSDDDSSAATPEQSSTGDDSPIENRETSTQSRLYSGRVETPQGEPIAGAKIWLAVASHNYIGEANRDIREGLLRELGTTDEQGRFEVVLDALTTQEIRKRLHYWQTQLVATAQGRGLDWMPLDVFADNPIPSASRDLMQERIDQSLGDGRFASRALKLRPDSQPVRGRLVNLEGHPLPNVTVLVENLSQPDIPRLLKAFEMSWKRELNEALSATGGVGGLARSELQKLIPPVTTNKNGEFELRGIGDDQLVKLVFDDDRVEARPVNVLGREMEAVSLPHIVWNPAGAKDVFVGRRFNYAVGPSVPVEGVVTDYDTGQPVAGVLVYVERLFKEPSELLRLDTRHMRAVTDRRGRFRITGMPPGEGHVVEVIPPRSEPYLMTSQNVSLSLDDGDAKRIEFQVKRGIWIEGRVTDKQSGQPLSATIDYLALRKNPHSLDKLGLDQGWIQHQQRYRTDRDGHYRTLGLPGPGVLFVTSQVPGYPLAAGAETIDGYDASGGVIPTTPFRLQVSDWHLLKQIDPAADATSFTCDLVLDAGLSIPGRVVGPDGKPVSDLHVLGQTERDKWWSPRYQDNVPTTDRFTVNGYDGKGPRQLFFKNQDETLVGQYRLEGDAPEEIVVALEPSVRVTGRLIENETDLPAARYFLSCKECYLSNEEYPPVKFMIHWCHTDDEGRFEIKGLMAGLTYKMYSLNENENNIVGNRFTIDLTAAKPGDVIELGDVTGPDSNQAGKKPPSDSQSGQPSRSQSSDEADKRPMPAGKMEKTESNDAGEPTAKRDDAIAAASYSGRIETPEGQPLAGAKIWLAMRSYDEVSGGLLRELGTADEQGRFQVALDSATTQMVRKRFSHWQTTLVATADGRGLGWMPLDVFADNPTPSDQRDTLQAHIDQSLGAGRFASRTLKLRPAMQPIRGRLLDVDGQPLPNVTVLVEQLQQPDIPLLLKAFNEESKDAFYTAINATGRGVGQVSRNELQMLIPPVTTDENGAFELAGIGDDQLVTLTFDREGVQSQVLYVLGRSMEIVRLPHAQHYPDGAKDVFAGRDLTYVLGPSVTVEGIVKDYDTGEPVARTWVVVERLFRERGGANDGQLRLDTRHMRTITDAVGRFRITGMPPGIGHVLEAKPPKSEPYLLASQNITLSLDDGDVKNVEIQVKKGIWIEGRVTDKQSGEPLSGTVDYLALEKNPHTLDKLGLGQGWEFSRYRIGKDGRYRTLGLPGPGVVLVRADGGYPRSVGAENVDGYKANPGGGYLLTNPISLPLSNWNFIKQINPEPDAGSHTCDVALDAGLSIPGRVVGPRGQSVTDLSVLGEIVNVSFWKPHATNTFTIEGYDGKGPRQLFFKDKNESLVGQFRLQGDAPKEIVVTLQPSVRVTGRLIENETQLPAIGYHLFCENCKLASGKTLPTKFRIDDCRTDEEGRFAIRGLVPGITYSMDAFNPQRFSSKRNRFRIDLTNTKPGDVIDLGDVTGPNRNRPQNSPGTLD